MCSSRVPARHAGTMLFMQLMRQLSRAAALHRFRRPALGVQGAALLQPRLRRARILNRFCQVSLPLPPRAMEVRRQAIRPHPHQWRAARPAQHQAMAMHLAEHRMPLAPCPGSPAPRLLRRRATLLQPRLRRVLAAALLQPRLRRAANPLSHLCPNPPGNLRRRSWSWLSAGPPACHIPLKTWCGGFAWE